jgi:hypothetical protein
MRATCSVLAMLTLLGFAGWVWSLESDVEPPSDGTVDVISASFGANCGAQKDNMLQWVQSACSGKNLCDFGYNWTIGNPASACNAQFGVKWRCSSGGRTFSYSTSSLPTNDAIIPLSCEKQLSTGPSAVPRNGG